MCQHNTGFSIVSVGEGRRVNLITLLWSPDFSYQKDKMLTCTINDKLLSKEAFPITEVKEGTLTLLESKYCSNKKNYPELTQTTGRTF